MLTKGFDLLRYGQAIQRMITEWYAYSQEILQQSSDLGFVREHFVKNILDNFLPKSVIIGSGEIVDSTGNRSGQQDIILYRSDFPVITSLTPVNTYLAEGVIATIEIKSDLSTGSPNHLHKAFQSALRTHTLYKQAHIVSGAPEHLEKLQEITNIKTYVIGYAGWQTEKAIFSQYISAGNSVGWVIPNLVCQPGFCILRNDGFINPEVQDERKGLLLNRENPYAVLLFHLLKHVMLNTGGASVTAFGIDAVMHYNLNPYFSFNPPLLFQRLDLLTTST